MITPSILPILEAPVILGESTEPLLEPTAESSRLCDNSFLCFRTLEFVLNFLRRGKNQIKDCNFFNFIIQVLGRRQTIDLALGSCPREALAAHFVHKFEHHRALADAEAAGRILLAMMAHKGISTPRDLAAAVGVPLGRLDIAREKLA